MAIRTNAEMMREVTAHNRKVHEVWNRLAKQVELPDLKHHYDRERHLRKMGVDIWKL